eukprot:TRINITY_DN24828_c0_g1_i1.p1 TRINITY_DN24828_c0_g1~~TRINITY_DN24828_c0_g1_i1.p1  ORF type:complete len:261 (+),score=42.87 TRINITY_DN24828_c0_g1_i1:168-950(+)
MAAGQRQEEDVLVIRNTFLEVRCKGDVPWTLQRSHSDTDLSDKSSVSKGSEKAGKAGQPYFPLSSFLPKGLPNPLHEGQSLSTEASLSRDMHDIDTDSAQSEGARSNQKNRIEATSSAGSFAAPSQAARSDVPSIGSISHTNGNCKPCFRLSSEGGCNKGYHCEFCHLDHVRKTRRRPCKAKRDQCKRLVAMVGDDALAMYAADGHQPDVCAEPGAISSGIAYLNNLLKGTSTGRAVGYGHPEQHHPGHHGQQPTSKLAL